MTATFDHKGPTVVNVMRNLTVGVFEHLSITSSLDVYVRMKYIEIILKVSALRKFKHVMVFLKEKGKEEGGDN